MEDSERHKERFPQKRQKGDEQDEGPRLSDAFLDRFSTMMNHEKVGAFLADQEHM